MRWLTDEKRVQSFGSDAAQQKSLLQDYAGIQEIPVTRQEIGSWWQCSTCWSWNDLADDDCRSCLDAESARVVRRDEFPEWIWILLKVLFVVLSPLGGPLSHSS
jgi:hypothetical protein